MPRKIPISHKKRKNQLLRKRAVKRGDVSTDLLQPPKTKANKGKGPAGQRSSIFTRSSRKLQSSFIKLSPKFLEETRVLASILTLPRPIPYATAVLPEHWLEKPEDSQAADAQNEQSLKCPRRPKWRYDMSKEELEANEEGLFKKWLAQTDELLNQWCSNGIQEDLPPGGKSRNVRKLEIDDVQQASEMPHAPTSYERNLEVWRQLWRVSEISQILLILLDSRCPSLHFPPALSYFLSSSYLTTRRRIILVLTKVDTSGPARADAWKQYLQSQFPDVKIVQAESYAVDKEVGNDETAGKRMHKPHMPSQFRQELVEALQVAHAELLTPPENIRNDPEKMKEWKPPVRRNVDWDKVLRAEGAQVGIEVDGVVPAMTTVNHDPDNQDNGQDEAEPEYVTVGLIGQPNVGKSSLLNALFGTYKVKASKTPGKTKHFQTLFWTSEVRLVDCPGLVIPNFVPMEMQVLSGILPISRVSVVPLCIHFAARLLPLERILSLQYPSEPSPPPPEDKRTWRGGMRVHAPVEQTTDPTWTAMDILIAYANKKGWVTAQVGRPDVYRAGNAILRALAENRVRWAFWPPGTDEQTIKAHQEPGTGIWIPKLDGDEDDDIFSGPSDIESVHSEADLDSDSDDDDAAPAEDDSDDAVEEADAGGAVGVTSGRFGALSLGDDDNSVVDD